MSLDSVLSFIKDFDFRYWSLLNVLITIVVLALSLIFINWLISRSYPAKADRIKKLFWKVWGVLLWTVIAFMITNLILTENYGRLWILLFVWIGVKANTWTSYVAKNYDRLVDKIAKRVN